MDAAYSPDFDTFCEILRDYSRHGIAYFKSLPDQTQRKMRAKLENKIEANDDNVDAVIAAIKRGERKEFDFLPMPKPGGRNFAASFFQPRMKVDGNGRYSCSYVVVFWIDNAEGKTIAIRLESGAAGSAHAFMHMQLTRSTRSPAIETSFETWIPTSYPAIPLGYVHPVQVFAGMAMAVHGYSADGNRKYVREVVLDSMKADIARDILAEIKRLFG